MPRENIQEEANKHYASRFDKEQCDRIAAAEDYDNDNRRDEAMEWLQEQPLSFERIITNHRQEEIQWEILLGTGGPADRVLVTTDFNGAVQSADYQYQDWFQPWTSAENQDEELVMRYAEIVGYYEVEVEQ